MKVIQGLLLSRVESLLQSKTKARKINNLRCIYQIQRSVLLFCWIISARFCGRKCVVVAYMTADEKVIAYKHIIPQQMRYYYIISFTLSCSPQLYSLPCKIMGSRLRYSYSGETLLNDYIAVSSYSLTKFQRDARFPAFPPAVMLLAPACQSISIQFWSLTLMTKRPRFVLLSHLCFVLNINCQNKSRVFFFVLFQCVFRVVSGRAGIINYANDIGVYMQYIYIYQCCICVSAGWRFCQCNPSRLCPKCHPSTSFILKFPAESGVYNCIDWGITI